MSGIVLAERLAELVAAQLDMSLQEEGGDWPLVLSRHACVASLVSRGETIQGFGAGPTAERARLRAIMECLERYAQFGGAIPLTHRRTGASLAAAAVSPESLGLYADSQYDAGVPFARYSPEDMLDWIELADLSTGVASYLPVEFVYPRAPIDRRPLVAETSSGTAAHSSRMSARLAAICELIERDSLLMFWHRQPPIRALSVDPNAAPDAAGDLEAIRSMGFVVVVCLLQFDLDVPCVLVLAFRGNRFAYGAGCHPRVNHALEHACGELGRLMRWQIVHGRQARRRISVPNVGSPVDHYALYDGGPYHHLLRQAVESTIRPDGASGNMSADAALPDSQALESVVACLRDRGYRVLECDLTPPDLQSSGVTVVRAFVPGLIQMYFGSDRIRFGCRRLWARHGPGRLCTIAPHFMI